MRLVFLGPPGAGKGTQAELLAEAKDLLHLSTGDMFRSAIARGTPTGLQAKSFMDQGQLVPDEVVDALVDERLKEEDARAGFLLDGYPRNLTQVEALDGMLAARGTPLDAVVYLDVPDEVLVGRIRGRAAQAAGGGAGGERADDTEEVARERLKVYHEHTAPLVDHYDKAGLLRRIDGTHSINKVRALVAAALDGEGVGS
ncbi:MAG: adenylate kinase [Planctomycetota bacterium]|jgi:adenylate kinase